MSAEITLALLKACGIPAENSTSVHYSHEVGGTPTIEVTYCVYDHDRATTSVVEYDLEDVHATPKETWRREWTTNP